MLSQHMEQKEKSHMPDCKNIMNRCLATFATFASCFWHLRPLQPLQSQSAPCMALLPHPGV